MDATSENASSNEQTHWSKDRLHADATRAAGGALNLVREIARISCQIDSTWTDDRLVKRLMFMSYDLQVRTRSLTTEAEKLHALNHFFFVVYGFRCGGVSPSSSHDPSCLFRLGSVISERSGAPLLIELLYGFLAERIGVQLEFVDLKPTCFLKWCENGAARFIDVTRQGAILAGEQLLETLHNRFRMTTQQTSHLQETCLIEPYAFERYISDYLLALKGALNSGHEPEKLLFLQDTLISYQPSNLQHVGERALLHRRLGNFKSALSDLKRYFAFHDRAKAAPELVKVFDEMMALLEKNKSRIEVID